MVSLTFLMRNGEKIVVVTSMKCAEDVAALVCDSINHGIGGAVRYGATTIRFEEVAATWSNKTGPSDCNADDEMDEAEGVGANQEGE